MKALPRFVESGWMVTGPERDMTYLAHVLLEEDEASGVWRVKQRVNCGQPDEERLVTEYPGQAQARAHLAQVYAALQEHGRWRIRQA